MMFFLERALPSRRPFGVNMRHSPGSTSQEDALTEVLQAGAHKLLTQAVEAEVASFLEAYAALVDGAGRRRLVRNGYLPERAIQTGIDRFQTDPLRYQWPGGISTARSTSTSASADTTYLSGPPGAIASKG